MTLAGSCPGTVFAQLGSGLTASLPTLLGAVVGSFTYGYIHTFLQNQVPGFACKLPAETLDSTFKLKQQQQSQPVAQTSSHKKDTKSKSSQAPTSGLSHFQLTTLLSITLTIILSFLSTYLPWQPDVSRFLPPPSLTTPQNSTLTISLNPTSPTWNPLLSGMGVGLAQLSTILLTSQPLGASTFYAYLGSHLVGCVDPKWETRAAFYKDFRKQWETAAVATGIVVGGLVSSILGGTNQHFDGVKSLFASTAHGGVRYDAMLSMFGGVFLVWGSRLAGGCTSGHGISGLGQLSVASLVTVAAMFGGGMLTAVFF
jgi:uncharacterized membrane protein YedE/YeeE